MKQTPMAEHKYVENVPELAILPTNSEVICRPCRIYNLSSYVVILVINNFDLITGVAE
jgi:hypothetical protein